tara:strand:+ start:1404 stop:3893 length:2490 start_codon:yes stop_codon:yes gene_type:complete
MSQEKAQLIAPIDSSFSVPGLTVSGVLTATTFDGTITGVADSITQGKNLNVGVITALSFSGNLTGDAGGLIGSPNTVAGVVTANSFVGGITGNITGDVIGNASGIGASIKQGNNLNVGIATAVEWYGDGSGVTGAGSSAYVAQEVTASSSETIIDLSYGNVIYFDSTTTSTTVGFASTSPAEQITFIRDTGTVTPSFTTGGVTMDGTDDYLSLAATTDFECTGDFTIECWLNSNNIGSNRGVFNLGAYNVLGGFELLMDDGVPLLYTTNSSNSATRITGGSITTGRWYHLALVRSGSTVTMYLDGSSVGSYTDSTTFGNGSNNSFLIGAGYNGSYMEYFDGVISNARFVKGTAVYTSNFTPSYEALTNITNTKLLCCQSDSSTTTAAVTPGTITANSSPTAGAQTISSSSSVTPSITWPDRVKWDGGSTPTLVGNDVSAAFQIFRFTTFDTGLNYNAWEEMIYDAPTQGGLFTWGNASDGLLGLNNTTYRSSPTQVGSNTNWSGLSRSINFSAPLFGVKADGTLWGWGSATNGELGQNYVSPLRLSSPVQISGTTWKNVDFGYQAAAAVKTDGTLWAWGKNDGGSSGVLGQNNLTNYSSPVQVGTETTWGTTMTTFGVSFRTMSNIKTDGTLWSWGYSDYGGSGHNNRTKYSSPRQVGTDTTWSSISQGYGAATAIKTDGTLWAWGRGRYGELPFNIGAPSGNRSSPTQIGTDTTWSVVSQGNGFGSAIKTDGTLWMWGSNSEGKLGQNNETQRSSPIQIPGTTWSDVCATAQNMQALKTDGTFWVWGHAGSGRLGLNAPGAAHISSPTQIPGTWQIIGSSGNTGSAIK